MPSLPPPSPEVIQEEILRRLDEDGVDRDMFGVREIASVSAHEIAAIWQALGGGLPRGEDPFAG